MIDKEMSEPVDPLWRYMSFSKFVALLKQSAIYFRRSDGFADKWEGAISGIGEREEYKDNTNDLFFSMVERFKLSSELTEQNKQEAVMQMTKLLESLNDKLRKQTFISCWHESGSESEAMWKLYSFDDAEGVAIQTTPSRMKELMPIGDGVELARVKYDEFEPKLNHYKKRCLNKRGAFKHEREARLLIIEENVEPDGKMERLLEVDLNLLIEKVVVSPYASPYLYELVVDVCKRYSVNVEVRKSSLNDEPFYG